MTIYPTIDRLTDDKLAALYFFQVERTARSRLCGVAGNDLDDPQMARVRVRVYRFGKKSRRVARRKVKKRR